MERKPCRGADAAIYWKPDGVVADWCPAADLEAEPVASVVDRRPAERGLRGFSLHLQVEVNIESSAHAKVAGEKGGSSFDDPSVVSEVKPLYQPVVGDLPLQLLQGPSPLFGRFLEPVGKCPAESCRSRVSAAGAHVFIPAAWSTCARALSIH